MVVKRIRNYVRRKSVGLVRWVCGYNNLVGKIEGLSDEVEGKDEVIEGLNSKISGLGGELNSAHDCVSIERERVGKLVERGRTDGARVEGLLGRIGDYEGVIDRLRTELKFAHEENEKIRLTAREALLEIEEVSREHLGHVLMGRESELNAEAVEGLSDGLASAYAGVVDNLADVCDDVRKQKKVIRELSENVVANAALAFASLSKRFARVPVAVYLPSSGSFGYVSPSIKRRRSEVQEGDLFKVVGESNLQKVLGRKGSARIEYNNHVLNFTRCDIGDGGYVDLVYIASRGRGEKAKVLTKSGKDAVESIRRFVKRYNEERSCLAFG